MMERLAAVHEVWEPQRIRFVKCRDLADHTLRLIPQLPPNVAGVAGIPRSGMTSAALLATLLHVPLYHVAQDGLREVTCQTGRSEVVRRLHGPVVVVDDTTWMGSAMSRARAALKRAKVKGIFAAVYASDPRHVDVYAIHHAGFHVLEWNLFNNQPLAGVPNTEFEGGIACDFDGVLCENPPVSDRDDLRTFREWLRSARPLYLPRRFPVPMVVSYRLEDWRADTEAWLRTWGVTVRTLKLHPAATVEERDKTMDVGAYKGMALLESPCGVMIESEPNQCGLIHEVSGKTVICPATGEVWQREATGGSGVPYHASGVRRLAVVTAMFSCEQRNENRKSNVEDFLRWMIKQTGADLWAIEGVYPDQESLRMESEHWQLVPLSDMLWHKERLLNLLVSRLPADYDAVAWVDADVILADGPALQARILKMLAAYPVGQVWDYATNLDANGQPAEWWDGITRMESMARHNADRPVPDVNAARSHAGLAWAMRRDVWNAIGGLYELEISGGADATMARAFYGRHRDGFLAHLNAAMRASMEWWSDRVSAVVKGKVGYVSQEVEHLYHGTMGNRRYLDRLLAVSERGYNPERDIVTEPNCPLRWSGSAPEELVVWLRTYLEAERREDDIVRR